MRVLADDNGLPRRQGYALVYVYIRRNFNRPIWDRNAYNVTIPETEAVGNAFFSVTVRDNDNQVGSFNYDKIVAKSVVESSGNSLLYSVRFHVIYFTGAVCQIFLANS